MATIIRDAYRENPVAARHTLHYLTNSTNQQRVAAQAMAGIVADTLNTCESMTNIAAIADQFGWIPSPPPEALESMLPQFIEISQDVRSALDATSPYRRSELLELPIRRLGQLRKGLVFEKNASTAILLGSITERWLAIVAAARRDLETQAKQSAEIPSVYIAGPALDPENAGSRFQGRTDLFRELEALILCEPPPVLLLYGGRRSGKTSALKQLPQRLGSGYIPLLVDVQGAAVTTTLAGLAHNLADQMIAAARRSRNLRLPPPDQKMLTQDPFHGLQEWLNSLKDLVGEKCFLLCLDEFERLSEVIDATQSRVPLNFLRHLLQHHHQWLLLFSGSHAFDELPAYWSDYLINTRTLSISYLQETEARELICHPVADFPDIYEDEAVDAIIRLTHCHPYLVQLICSELVDHLNREHQRRANAADVNSVVPHVLVRGSMYFRELWDGSLSKQEREFLLNVIRGIPPDTGDRVVLHTLLHKEILERINDTYQFQVPLIRMFIESKMDFEE